MIHVKLQLGCLLVILYIVISYIKETTKTKMKCDHFFDALMIITPWAVFFDGFTAWTVNHMDIVPDMVNRIAHLLFFLLMDLTIIITTAYTFDQLLGFRKKRHILYLGIPGIISLLLVCLGIGDLRFIEGATVVLHGLFRVRLLCNDNPVLWSCAVFCDFKTALPAEG